MNKKGTLIFDIDGVLIDWMSQVPIFCKKIGIDPVNALKNYTAHEHLPASELFGVSPHIGMGLIERYNIEHGRYLTAFTDAVENLHKIAREYNLVALTKFGSSVEHWMIRNYNLETFFPGCFSELISIDLTVNKSVHVADYLKKDSNVIAFIDDQMSNIIDVKENNGIPCIHMNRYDERADVRDMSEMLDFINSLDV